MVFSPLVRRTFDQAMATMGCPTVQRVVHDDNSVLDSVVQLSDIETVKEPAAENFMVSAIAAQISVGFSAAAEEEP